MRVVICGWFLGVLLLVSPLVWAYEIYHDDAGNIYLKAPDKLVVLPRPKAIPVSVPAWQGLLKLYEVNGHWQVRVLTQAEWAALSLREGHSLVDSVQRADFDGDGTQEIFVVLRHEAASQLLIRDTGEGLVVEAEQFETAGDGRMAAMFMSMAMPSAAPVPATMVGLSGGEFRVDESGAATYVLPLSLPDGIAGVRPQLAFSYSSHGGDGYLGMGWSFAGASAITRCPKNLALDLVQGNVSFSTSDRLCLDGQRLVRNGAANDKAVTDATYWNSSSQYHTELDSFVLVRQHGSGSQGPLAFTVETKSGEIHYYGKLTAVSGNDTMGRSLALSARSYGNVTETGEDAFFDTAVGSNVARLWALKAIRDVKGNYIVFKYHEDPAAGEHYLTEVHYTGRAGGNAPFARVMLNYIDNPKAASGWQAGRRVAMTRLLETVDVALDGQSYRHYRLHYFSSDVAEEKNYLLSIQECADPGANCLPAVQFDWQRPAAKNTSYQQHCVTEPGVPPFCYPRPVTENYAPFATTSETKGSSVERYYQQLLDINGDGYVDMVYPRAGSWRVRLGGGGVGYQRRCVTVPGEPQYCWDEPVTHNYTTEQTLGSKGAAKKEYARSIDYNGDGQRDLLVADSAGSNWFVMAFTPSESTVTYCEPQPGQAPLCDTYIVQLNYTLIDTGRTAHGLEGGAFVADIDGDGLEDIVYLRDNRFKWYRNLGAEVSGSRFSIEQDLGAAVSNANYIDPRPAHYTADMKSASLVDINGDGKTDLLLRVSQTEWQPDPGAGCQIELYSTDTRLQDTSMPLNRCGQWVTMHSVRLFVSTGSGLTERQNLGDVADLRVADLNGDGYTDILYRSGTTWYYRLSDGTQLLSPRSTGLSNANNLSGLTYFIDLNGDGRADVLLPTANNAWAIYLSRPSRAHEQVIFERRGSRSFDANAAIQFADVNADGKPDLLTATNDNGWKIFLSHRPQIKEHVINRITSGWGAVTDIEYRSITDSAVYFRESTGNNSSSDTFSPRAGMVVVSKVSTEVNSGKFVSVSYQYGGLLVHKKGRGMLGFEVLRTTDSSYSNVVTETVYHQQWPYTGIPKTTTQRRGGVVISYARNTVAQRSTAWGGILPYISSSEDINWQHGSDNQQYPLSKTVSSFSYDDYGNLTASTVTQSDINAPAKKLVTETTNVFNSSALYRRYGRLTRSTVSKTLDGNSTSRISRQSEFTYYGTDLLLQSEILSPADNKTKVTTTYGYDAAGNITSTQVTAGINASGSQSATRSSSTQYDARFRYVAARTDAAGLRTTYRYSDKAPEAVTGRLLSMRAQDANNLVSKVHFNALGQETKRETKGQGANDGWVQRLTQRHFCSSISCPVAGAFVRLREYGAGQPEQQQFMDKYGRAVGTATGLLNDSLSVSHIQYNDYGWLYRQYEPGINGSSGHYSQSIYDIMGRVRQVSMASGGSRGISYQGLLTVTNDTQGKFTRTLNNYLGQTTEVRDHLNNTLRYAYDAYGNLKTVTAVSADNVSSLRTTNHYDAYGRKTSMTDQDKGNWIYSYNAFGELLSQTDAKGQATLFSYESAGRMTRRQDPAGTTCWDYGNNAASYNRGQLTRVRSFNGNVACNTTATADYEEVYSYNSRGLLGNTLVKTAGSSFAISRRYDAFNRVDLLTYPSWSLTPDDDIVIRHEYQNGSLVKLVDNKSNTVYQNVQQVNARGQATKVVYGNGVTEDRGFYSSSGWLDTLSVKRGAAHIHNMDYNYDLAGNVTRRQLNFGSVGSAAGFSEVFNYDHLHRVTSRTISNLSGSTGYAALPAAVRMNETYRYDHFGNLTFKTNVGNYCYDASKTNRLTGVWSGANCTGTRHYNMAYDANGNVTGDSKRSFSYTAFDKPSRVTQGANRTDFAYGPNRELYRRTDVRDNKTTDTLYIGGLYERTSLPSAVMEHKFYVGNAVITKRSNGQHDAFYLHKDGQGSTTSITNASGAVRQQFIYDPWGRQYSVSTNSVFTTYSNPGTSKGYTGHNMVNDFEVIHMGGRTYNPVLGRFMQADPFIQAPSNLQNYNRYSYVLNNPMSYTDPSGYFFKPLKKVGRNVIRAATKVFGTELVNFVGTVVSTAYGGPWGAAAWTYEFNRAMGASSSGALRSAVIAAASAWTFSKIGSYYEGQSDSGSINFGGNELTAGQVAGQITAHAMVGGVAASLQGGKFGHGFFSAGVTKGAGGAWLPGGGNLSGGQVVYGTVVSAVIGGTASVIAGGKFENGAKTAVFQYLYNQAGRVNYRQIFKDVKRTWSEYWSDTIATEQALWDEKCGAHCLPAAAGAVSLAASGGASVALWAGRSVLAGRLGSLSLGAAGTELYLNRNEASVADFAGFGNQSAVYFLDRYAVPMAPSPVKPFLALGLDAYGHTSSYLYRETSKNGKQ